MSLEADITGGAEYFESENWKKNKILVLVKSNQSSVVHASCLLESTLAATGY